MNDEQMAKALKDLIDETIAEIEDLKKSDRFSASEIKIEGPGDGIDSKPSNGKLDTKKADDDEKDEEKDEEKEVEKKEEKGCSDVEEDVLDEVEKKEKEEDEEDDKEDKKIAQKEVDKHNEDKHGEPKDKDSAMKKSEEQDLKKSIEASEELMKSYIDSKIAPIEDKISSILDAVKELADSPVERKSVPSNVQPLTKSELDGPAPLKKSEVIDKMIELKKSGEAVSTEDITRAELGGPTDLERCVNKYKLTRD